MHCRNVLEHGLSRRIQKTKDHAASPNADAPDNKLSPQYLRRRYEEHFSLAQGENGCVIAYLSKKATLFPTTMSNNRNKCDKAYFQNVTFVPQQVMQHAPS
jgi:hypothetical protein